MGLVNISIEILIAQQQVSKKRYFKKYCKWDQTLEASIDVPKN